MDNDKNKLMNITELIKELNEKQILQTHSINDQKELEFLDDWYEADSGLDIEKHRWYELSTSVFTNENKESYLGIRHISNQYSQRSSYDDHYHHYEFFEMIPEQTITYIKKN